MKRTTPIDPARVRHGSYLGYLKDRCRCDQCRGAWADRCRRYYHTSRQPRSPRIFPTGPLLDQLETWRRPTLVFGVSGTTWCRWASEGLTVWEADRAAIRLGHHPAEIWPDWWQHTTTDHDEQEHVA